MAGTTAAPPPTAAPPAVDPRSGYESSSGTYHSLRQPVPLPPESTPLSIASYALSLLPSPLPSNPAFIDSATGATLSFPSFLSQVRSLSSSLSEISSLSPGATALVLAPTLLSLPVLHFALLSLGVSVSPANPLSTPSEISHQIRLSRPSIAFSVSAAAHKLPSSLPTVILDSPLFQSMLSSPPTTPPPPNRTIRQSDPAAILYSSGTTGKVKGVVLTHRNFIAIVAGYHQTIMAKSPDTQVALFTIPLFHVFGFFMMFRAVALGETIVLMGRFDFGEMLSAIERFGVTYMPVSPPLVVAMVKSEEAGRRDLSSLKVVGSGGAPLGRDVVERFQGRFPWVEVVQGYGMTESAGSVSSQEAGTEEGAVGGSTGRLAAGLEARIVDPGSGAALPPEMEGELWVRGPTIMKGYIGDDVATASTLDSEGWLKTGDLCYFNKDGFLFIVDRLKELIKYKAYQVPPAELEHILQSHPEIADAAVIPYPDEAAGQIPMAFVVRQPGSSLNEEKVMDFVAKQVAPYKKVRKVAFVSAIPKSAAGKILRRELVKHALSAPSSKL